MFKLFLSPPLLVLLPAWAVCPPTGTSAVCPPTGTSAICPPTSAVCPSACHRVHRCSNKHRSGTGAGRQGTNHEDANLCLGYLLRSNHGVLFLDPWVPLSHTCHHTGSCCECYCLTYVCTVPIVHMGWVWTSGTCIVRSTYGLSVNLWYMYCK